MRAPRCSGSITRACSAATEVIRYLPAKPDASGFASPWGPFNPRGVAIVEGRTCSDSHCVSAPDGLTVPVNNFAMNQRMFNIYDGPTYQDSNAYLDIKKLPITDCQASGTGGNWYPITLQATTT